MLLQKNFVCAEKTNHKKYALMRASVGKKKHVTVYNLLLKNEKRHLECAARSWKKNKWGRRSPLVRSVHGNRVLRCHVLLRHGRGAHTDGWASCAGARSCVRSLAQFTGEAHSPVGRLWKRSREPAREPLKKTANVARGCVTESQSRLREDLGVSPVPLRAGAYTRSVA
jgi:hypothetical protein